VIGSIRRAVVVWAAIAAAGCSRSQPPQFRLNLEGPGREEVSLVQIDAITEELQDLFGTPDEPTVPEGVGLDTELLQMAAGPVGGVADEQGRIVGQRGLYRQHCAECHGISGDGAGPLALIFNPYPRDLRYGVCKYTSTRAGAKPTREDLKRILLKGLPATGMPSYAELDPLEKAALVEYVKYLSIRGETELYLVNMVVDEDEYLPLGVDAKERILEEAVLWTAEMWDLPEQHPAEYVVEPPMPQVRASRLPAESIARGRQLYVDKRAQCPKCHGAHGSGDGEEKELYDDWNKRKKGVTPRETEELAPLFTLPIQRLRARNFLEGAFRGGNQPEDIYRRIHAGVKGTPMPAAGPGPGTAGALKPEEIWHLANYILSLAERGG